MRELPVSFTNDGKAVVGGVPNYQDEHCAVRLAVTLSSDLTAAEPDEYYISFVRDADAANPMPQKLIAGPVQDIREGVLYYELPSSLTGTTCLAAQLEAVKTDANGAVSSVVKSPPFLIRLHESLRGEEALPVTADVDSLLARLIDATAQAGVFLHPDWSENDPTDRAYVANRTHWRAVGSKTDVTFVKSSGEWWESGDLGTGNYGGFACPLVEGHSYVITYNGQDYEFVVQLVYQVDNGTYLGTSGQTVRRYAIGNTRLATNEVFSVAPSGYTPAAADFPFCLTYETDEINGETQILSEFAAVDSSLSDGAQVSFSVAAVSYHLLPEKYLPDGVAEAAREKHTHANKAVLDGVDAVNVLGINAPANLVRYQGIPINSYSATSHIGAFYGALHAGVAQQLSSVQTSSNEITVTALLNPCNYSFPEYILAFTTGATAPTLTLPAAVEWVDELTVEANKRYQISIVDNIALWCAVDVEVASTGACCGAG